MISLYTSYMLRLEFGAAYIDLWFDTSYIVIEIDVSDVGLAEDARLWEGRVYVRIPNGTEKATPK